MKVETFNTSYLQNGRFGGLEICCAVGGLRALKNKILASGPPVKGAQKRIILIKKIYQKLVARFSRNLMQCRTRTALELSRTRRSADDRYYYETPEFDSIHAECIHMCVLNYYCFLRLQITGSSLLTMGP